MPFAFQSPVRLLRRSHLEDLERFTDAAARSGLSVGAVGAGLLLLQKNLASQDSSSDATPYASLQASPDDLVSMPVSSYLPVVQSPLTEVEDDRTFYPDSASRPLRRLSSKPVRRMAVAASPLAQYLPAGITPPARAQVILCIRRKARRQVLFAKGHGGGGHRKPRLTSKSNIWC